MRSQPRGLAPGMTTLFDGAGNAYSVHVGDGLSSNGRGRKGKGKGKGRGKGRQHHHHDGGDGVLRNPKAVAAFAEANGVEATGRKRNEILADVAAKRPITVNSEKQFTTILSYYITREGWADAKPMVIAQQILGPHAGDFAGKYNFREADEVRLLEHIQRARRSAHAYKLRLQKPPKPGPPGGAEATVAGTGVYGLQSLGRGY